MQLKGEQYIVCYNTATNTISCQGTLRLNELEEYAPLIQLLNDVLAQKPAVLTLDLRDLKFLNSSGFTVLSKFVLKVRQEETIKLEIQAAKSIPWHQKSLKNLQRLMPNLELLFE
ncbi:MAG TPA: hypothetical protein V6D25_18780 [Leptolyngbyaceae cyanobacterium]